MNEWSAWVGREERRTDRVDPACAARWLATFDLPAPQGETFRQQYSKRTRKTP